MSSTRIITVLGFSCGATVVLYLALIAATMFFATVQTRHQSQLREAQTNLSLLEDTYYQSLDQVQKIDPSTLGLVQPKNVAYVKADGSATALSRASF